MVFQGSVEINPAVLLSNAKSPVDYFETNFEILVLVYPNGHMKEQTNILRTLSTKQ